MKIRTTSYTYAVELAATNQEVVAFHWEGHRAGKFLAPHLHIGYATKTEFPHLPPKAHIPTGRVAFEDVIYFMIQELGVPPLQRDWKDVIAQTRQPFMVEKSW